MPRINTDRQASTERQQARAAKSSATVLPFSARVTITEQVPPPNESVAADIDRPQRSFAAQKAIWLDRILFDCKVPHVAFRVAVLIGSYLNRTSGDAWPSQGKLAADLGVTRRTVQRALDDLIAAGHLAVKGLRGHTNHYRPLFETEDAQPVAQVDTTSVTQVVYGDATTLTQEDATSGAGGLRQIIRTEPSLRRTLSKKTISKEEYISAAIDSDLKDAAIRNESDGGERKQTTASVSYGGNPVAESNRPAPPENGFWEFWQVYPLKVARNRAQGIYAKIIKSKKATAEELLAGAMRYAAARHGQDETFTKHPSTWLNGGCWTDEMQPQSSIGQPSSADSAVRGMFRHLNRPGQ